MYTALEKAAIRGTHLRKVRHMEEKIEEWALQEQQRMTIDTKPLTDREVQSLAEFLVNEETT